MKTKNIGSSFDDYLKAETILDEATAVAVKRVIAWQIDQEMKSQNLTKSTIDFTPPYRPDSGSLKLNPQFFAQH